MGVLRYARRSGAAGQRAGPVHDREPDHRPRRRQEVRRQQIHRTYGSDKLERLIWAIQ